MDKREILKKVVAGTAVVIVILIASVIFKSAGESMATSLSSQLASDLASRITSVRSITASPDFSRLQLERLREQLNSAYVEAQHHLSLVQQLYGLYFMQVAMFVLTTAFAAILLVFVSREGWKETDPYLLIAFSICATAAVSFSTLPNVFKMADNIDNNKNSYVQCLNIGDEISTYLRTYKAPAKGATLSKQTDNTPEHFIATVDEEHKKVQRIYLLFDLTEGKSFSQIGDSLRSASSGNGK